MRTKRIKTPVSSQYCFPHTRKDHQHSVKWIVPILLEDCPTKILFRLADFRYNKQQLKGIRLYQKIASGEGEVEPDGPEQEEPEFPEAVNELANNNLWRIG